MKVLIIDGSPRKGNCTYLINELTKTFNSYGVDTEIVKVGNQNINGCKACLYCSKNGKCIQNDIVNETQEKFKEASGMILVSPVYYASPNGTLISFLDRFFYSSIVDKKMKVGASFAVARRGGTVSTFDVLNKYFTISGMPLVSGDYWNNGFGGKPGDILEDLEGLRNAREVAKRMVFLMKAISDAKDKYSDLLVSEERARTSFIR